MPPTNLIEQNKNKFKKELLDPNSITPRSQFYEFCSYKPQTKHIPPPPSQNVISCITDRKA